MDILEVQTHIITKVHSTDVFFRIERSAVRGEEFGKTITWHSKTQREIKNEKLIGTLEKKYQAMIEKQILKESKTKKRNSLQKFFDSFR
jgi:hypothetical protein